LLSPDEDFSTAGVNSGIKYATSFEKYKEMLSEDPDSRTFKRIFSEFDASLFGVEPTLSNDFVVDDGDYDSEVENFKNGLHAETIVDVEVEDFENGLHAETIADAEVDEPTFPLPPLPTPPVRSDRHVSISVTSHVSHTVATSSQVSSVINSGPTPPPECEVEEDPPPRKKDTRPQPTKKKEIKVSKPTTTTPKADTDTAPTRRKQAARPAKTAPVEPPTRVLRNHS